MLSGWQRLTAEERAEMADGIVHNNLEGGPWHLEIHPTNRCNVKCFFCINNGCEAFKNESQLPWPRLQAFLERLTAEGLRMLRLSGGGEPLLYSSIRDLLDLLGQKHVRLVDLNTNGTLLKPFAKTLVELGLDNIAVSLNEVTPQLYARTMGVSEKLFHHVLNGLEALNEARDGLPAEDRPNVRLQFFLHKDNWRLIPEMAALGQRVAADQIFIRSIIGPSAGESVLTEDLPEIKSQLREIIQEDNRHPRPRLLFGLSRESGLDQFVHDEQRKNRHASAPPMLEFEPRQPRHEYCYMPWYTALVTARGTVHPCCIAMDVELGNILRQPWDEIWNGADFQALRREFRQLALLRGDMKYSPRLHCHLRPRCIGRYDCQWTYDLCSPEFYETVFNRLQNETSILERARTAGQDKLLRLYQRLKAFKG